MVEIRGLLPLLCIDGSHSSIISFWLFFGFLAWIKVRVKWKFQVQGLHHLILEKYWKQQWWWRMIDDTLNPKLSIVYNNSTESSIKAWTWTHFPPPSPSRADWSSQSTFRFPPCTWRSSCEATLSRESGGTLPRLWAFKGSRYRHPLPPIRSHLQTAAV